MGFTTNTNLHVWELEVKGRFWIQNQQQKNSTSEAMSQLEASGGRTELPSDGSKKTPVSEDRGKCVFSFKLSKTVVKGAYPTLPSIWSVLWMKHRVLGLSPLLCKWAPRLLHLSSALQAHLQAGNPPVAPATGTIVPRILLRRRQESRACPGFYTCMDFL